MPELHEMSGSELRASIKMPMARHADADSTDVRQGGSKAASGILIDALNDFRVLIVPGLHGSGADHWQTRWQQLFPWFERVEQEQWDVPDLLRWSGRVEEALHESAGPTLLIAHSFGCLASVHAASAGIPHLAGALLVAPADPIKFGIGQQMQRRRLSCPVLVVGSMNDPWMGARQAAGWAKSWRCNFINAGALGHINAESRLGNWEYGLSLISLLIGEVAQSV